MRRQLSLPRDSLERFTSRTSNMPAWDGWVTALRRKAFSALNFYQRFTSLVKGLTGLNGSYCSIAFSSRGRRRAPSGRRLQQRQRPGGHDFHQGHGCAGTYDAGNRQHAAGDPVEVRRVLRGDFREKVGVAELRSRPEPPPGPLPRELKAAPGQQQPASSPSPRPGPGPLRTGLAAAVVRTSR